MDHLYNPTINIEIAEKAPNHLLANALVDLVTSDKPEDLATITGLTVDRCAEIIHLKQLLTNCHQPTKQ